jgi:hypothetical protein
MRLAASGMGSVTVRGIGNKKEWSGSAVPTIRSLAKSQKP